MNARLQIAVRFDHQRGRRADAHIDLHIDALHAVDVERVDGADLAHVAAHLLVALDGTRVGIAHFAIVGVDDDGATAKGNGTAQGQQGTHGVSFMIVQDKKKAGCRAAAAVLSMTR